MVSNPFTNTAPEPERLPNVEALHEYLLKTDANAPGTLAKNIPDLPSRKEICIDFFRCNVWDAEPHLLDDLHQAKESENKEEITRVREMIRAASWASHGRTDPEVCLKLLNEIKWKDNVVREAITNFFCDEAVEDAVQAVEKEIDGAWNEIAKNSEQATDARTRLHALRQIRDQLYFQRLYSNLCAIGKAG